MHSAAATAQEQDRPGSRGTGAAREEHDPGRHAATQSARRTSGPVAARPSGTPRPTASCSAMRSTPVPSVRPSGPATPSGPSRPDVPAVVDDRERSLSHPPTS